MLLVNEKEAFDGTRLTRAPVSTLLEILDASLKSQTGAPPFCLVSTLLEILGLVCLVVVGF